MGKCLGEPMCWLCTMGLYEMSIGEKGDRGTEAVILERSPLLEDRKVGVKEQRSRQRNKRNVEAQRGGSQEEKAEN